MDVEKVVLKFKLNAKGNQTIAYCDEYPQVQGLGNNEGAAIGHFWKAFNNLENKNEFEKTQKKKAEIKNVQGEESNNKEKRKSAA